MSRHIETTQIKVRTSKLQAIALEQAARDKGVSKQALVREGIRRVTGVRSGIQDRAPGHISGFCDPTHPSYRGKRREASG